MKKMIKVLMVIFALTFFVFVSQNVHAEEVINEEVFNEPTVEPTPEVTPEVIPEDIPIEEPVVDEVVDTPVEEEVDFRIMIKTFLDEWLIAILATLGGFAGTTGVMVLGRKIISTIIEKLEQSLKANEEGNENLKKSQEFLVDGLKTIDAKLAEFEAKCSAQIEKSMKQITESINAFEEKYNVDIHEAFDKISNCINEIGFLKDEDSKFKELVALLVTSNPQLASNGYATKILELLHEGSDSNE